MPMIKFSSAELSPRETTLQFLNFFARNYMPLGKTNEENSMLAYN